VRVIFVAVAVGTLVAMACVALAQPDGGYVVKGRHAGQGEQCIVCGQRIFGEDVVEVQYKGRTFYVGAPLLEEFERDPQQYFAKLQARSALFDESALPARRMSFGWLWFGVYVLAGIVSAAIAAYVAVGKARPALPWFFAGLFGNVVAVVAVVVAPRRDASALPAGIPRGLRKVPTTRTPRPCPACGASNHPSAAACSACGAPLSPTVAAETAGSRSES